MTLLRRQQGALARVENLELSGELAFCKAQLAKLYGTREDANLAANIGAANLKAKSANTRARAKRASAHAFLLTHLYTRAGLKQHARAYP